MEIDQFSERGEAEWFTASRDGCAVRLWLEPAEATTLAALWQPYISLKAGDHAPPRSWTILPAGEVGDGTAVHQDPLGTDVAYRLWLKGRDKVVHIAPEGAMTQRRRLVRCLIRRQFMSRGDAFLHSALLVNRRTGQGLAIAGGKRSGKTTSMLALLSSGYFDYSTNDDLTIRLSQDSLPGAFGWPRSIAIRRDTLRLLARSGSALREALQSSRHPSRTGTSRPVDRRGILLPLELTAATGARMVDQVPLAAIVVPRFDSAVTHPVLERVDDPAERSELVLSCLEDRASKQEEWLDPYFVRPSTRDLVNQAVVLAQRVPAYRLTQSMACTAESAQALDHLAHTLIS